MQAIDFYTLTRQLQDRLLSSIRAEFDPKPLLIQLGTKPKDYLWLGSSVAALVALLALCTVGFGSLESGMARHPLPLVALYVALVAAVAVGVLQARAYRAAIIAVPFPPGVYVFDAALIDAREPKLRVYPLAELTDVSAAGGRVTLRFGGAQYDFVVDPDAAEQAVRLVRAAGERMSIIVDDDARRPLDPLVPLAVASPLAPTNPLEEALPGWVRMRFVIAGAIGLLGAGLYFARDSSSDKRLFEWARSKDDVATYQLYLERGDAHRTEIARVHLPRAELRLAEKEGTVEAIDALAARSSDTDIGKEIDTARAKAIVAVFEKARAGASLAELMQFDERYPGHHLAQFVNDAKHAIYQRARADFVAKLKKPSAQTDAFVTRLFASVEKTGAKWAEPGKPEQGVVGPSVAFVIHRVGSKNMDRADDLVMKSPWNRGDASLPTRYLDGAHLEPHEQRAAKAFAEMFAKRVSPDIARFEPGPLIDGGDRPAVKVPTLFVAYRFEPSGSAYASKKPRGIFIGLVFFFEMEFVLPSGGDALGAKHTFAVKIPVRLLKDLDDGAPSGTIEKAMYDAILKEAFDSAHKRYFAPLFE
jgi:hypothetical protein